MRQFRIAAAITAMEIALPALAQSVATFDGTYAGVSGTMQASGGRSCTAASPAPR